MEFHFLGSRQPQELDQLIQAGPGPPQIPGAHLLGDNGLVEALGLGEFLFSLEAEKGTNVLLGLVDVALGLPGSEAPLERPVTAYDAMAGPGEKEVIDLTHPLLHLGLGWSFGHL